jgi:hypothetical protein
MKRLLLIALTACLAAVQLLAQDEVPWDRKQTGFASTPKVGAFFISKYAYSDLDGQHGFSQRLTRTYVDGTILNDFKYRVQIQINNAAFHMKDYFVEWARWKEFSVKIGQYKRAFLFENPYNPWDVGFGDYSQITKKFSGMGDYCGEAGSTGGRDMGLQFQGDLFPVSSDGHRLIHYQLQLMNGQGINTGDANARKDLIGSLQIQPVQDLMIGVFGWTGDYVANGVTVDRNRWAVSAKYEHDAWSARFEYASSRGHKIAEYNPATKTFRGTGMADGWYAAVGVPVNAWLKLYAKYDVYRDQATWDSAQTVWAFAPNMQIHKNLMLQLQYNYVDNRLVPGQKYNEFWAEVYVRF